MLPTYYFYYYYHYNMIILYKVSDVVVFVNLTFNAANDDNKMKLLHIVLPLNRHISISFSRTVQLSVNVT